ncbi:hypothetical protein VPH35_046388 [Triticum aestivum]|uniref:Uncharacterized protein n=1 Tax=Triticum turgidum subsp. durum TaxID=4567 RepID=A0A9R0VNT9_TRITD|nr:unnamed protein product [Triticum turgidum subsp. durum]
MAALDGNIATASTEVEGGTAVAMVEHWSWTEALRSEVHGCIIVAAVKSGYFGISDNARESLSGGRPNVYDQGCLSNFLEVFCTKVQASKLKFQTYIQEEVRAPPANRVGEVEDEPAGARHAKVEDDRILVLIL